jgi:hypothetical protein
MSESALIKRGTQSEKHSRKTGLKQAPQQKAKWTLFISLSAQLHWKSLAMNQRGKRGMPRSATHVTSRPQVNDGTTCYWWLIPDANLALRSKRDSSFLGLEVEASWTVLYIYIYIFILCACACCAYLRTHTRRIQTQSRDLLTNIELGFEYFKDVKTGTFCI